MPIPMRAPIRCENGPRHICKAPLKKRCGEFYDIVRRLEPCDEAKIVVSAEFPKTDKSMHLVFVTADFFGKSLNAHNI